MQEWIHSDVADLAMADVPILSAQTKPAGPVLSGCRTPAPEADIGNYQLRGVESGYRPCWRNRGEWLEVQGPRLREIDPTLDLR